MPVASLRSIFFVPGWAGPFQTPGKTRIKQVRHNGGTKVKLIQDICEFINYMYFVELRFHFFPPNKALETPVYSIIICTLPSVLPLGKDLY